MPRWYNQNYDAAMTDLEREINDAVAMLMKCGKMYYENRQRVAALGGAYFSAAAEAAAPKSKKEHYRYSTPKLTKKLRAPKGMGVKVASYTSGNLGRSINVLKFRQAKSKVFVGAKLARTATGRFNGRRADGYYMHFTEKGTKQQRAQGWFMASWQASKGRVLTIMTKEFERLGRQFEQQNRVA